VSDAVASALPLRLPADAAADLQAQADRLGCNRTALARTLLLQGLAQLEAGTEPSPAVGDAVALRRPTGGDENLTLIEAMAAKKNLATIIIKAASSFLTPSTLTPSTSSLVVRITKSDRYLLDNLMDNYSETMGNIFEKSIMLYQSIVEAGEQGGKFLMLTSHSRVRSGPGRVANKQTNSRHTGLAGNDTLNGAAGQYDNPGEYYEQVKTINFPGSNYRNTGGGGNGSHDVDHEIILAVRDQFAEEGKTPISLNRIYIKATKGLKSERVAIRASSAFIERLEDTEKRTGLSKSDLLRDGLHLYSFVKREFDKGGTAFYVGNMRVQGI
jgi:hypothetical protein